MKRLTSSLLLIGLVLAAGSVTGESYLEARRLANEGRILPLERILDATRQVHPGQILEVELDDEGARMIYEVEILDKRGTVWEIRVDAVTGEVIEQELED